MKKIIIISGFLLLGLTTQAQVKPDVMNSLGGSSQYSGGYLAFSVGEPVIGTSTGGNTTLTQGFLQTWKTMLQGNIALKLFLEGLYSGNSAMRQAQNVSGAQFAAGIADKVTIELHNATNQNLSKQ